MKRVIQFLFLFLVCTISLRAQESFSRFSFSGYTVRLVPSDTYRLDKSAQAVPYTQEIKENGVFYMEVSDQRGRVPKDEVTLNVNKIEYLYLHNCILIMEEPIPTDSLTLMLAASNGDLKINATNLTIDLGGGSHLNITGNIDYLKGRVWAGGSLDTSSCSINRSELVKK